MFINFVKSWKWHAHGRSIREFSASRMYCVFKNALWNNKASNEQRNNSRDEKKEQ